VDWIGLAEFQYNNLVHKATCIMPFYANYGFHPTFSVTPLQKSIPPLPTITDFTSYLETIHSELQAKLKIAQDTAKRKYDKHHTTAPSFKTGDLVMLS